MIMYIWLFVSAESARFDDYSINFKWLLFKVT